MPGYRTFKEIVESNSSIYSSWRKVPTQTTAARIWFDLCMSPGNPVPNYYASSPLTSVALSQSSSGGLFHGGNVSPQRKFLRKLTVMTPTAGAVPLYMLLCDYLLYYPFVDEGEPTQNLTTSTPLPRYSTGVGVQMMAVVVAGQAGGQTFNVTYTNSNNVSGRTSETVTTTTQAVNGTLITGTSGPFIQLQQGDIGVKSIESVNFLTADVGLLTLVLVKPLATLTIRGVDAPVEVDYLQNFSTMPRIYDDAYLNFICCPNGTLASANLSGDITINWE
jgi:hypothetical protein